ncbi:histidine phosphatase family protein [Miltoncostaea marina]|uniref:histidine phosphatase family protein n=1 Tax=Miltoncostaea marina TaxID=2843215 RepID=UPI001C3C4F70|nr:histidine phosphatase family protein [Miltoncostaea marina]
MRLILVRHGQSEWNAAGRLQGAADPPLSGVGRRQAEALRPLVAALRPDLAVSSDLRRARETLALLGLAVPELPPDARLREADLGDWTARLPVELGPADRQAFARWRLGHGAPPGGEPWRATRARVAAALADLAASGARRVVAVTHGGPVRAACQELAGLDPEHLVPVRNASVTVLETEPVPHLLGFGMEAPAPVA